MAQVAYCTAWFACVYVYEDEDRRDRLSHVGDEHQVLGTLLDLVAQSQRERELLSY